MSHTQRLARRYCRYFGLLAWVGLIASAHVALAQTVNLADLNSQLGINTAASGSGSWSVDAVNYADLQALFYQLGSSGSPSAWQYASSSSFSTSGSGSNGAIIQYLGNNGLQLTQIVTLLGSQPGSGSSLVSEDFVVSNFGPAAVNLRLFEYNNLQLSNSGDTLQFQAPSGMIQTSPTASAELVATGPPTAYETGTVPAVWGMFEDDSPVLLSDAGSATGDTASAMEWDTQLGAGNSYLIGQQYSLNIVPEPSTVSLLVALVVCSALAGAEAYARANVRNKQCTAEGVASTPSSLGPSLAIVDEFGHCRPMAGTGRHHPPQFQGTSSPGARPGSKAA